MYNSILINRNFYKFANLLEFLKMDYGSHLMIMLARVKGQGPEGCTRGTSYPGRLHTGVQEDESKHSQFFCDQAQNY